jgi:hypothetical protein
MAYTRTGRPPGRPKTKEYVTLMARVPQDLADQAKRYAGLQRQTMSDVLRDGLLMLLQEEDPYRPYVSDMHRVQEIVLDTKAAIPALDSATSQPGIVSDSNTVAEPYTQEGTLVSETTQTESTPLEEYGETLQQARNDFERALEPEEQRIWQIEDMPLEQPEPLPAVTLEAPVYDNRQTESSVPAYDTTKYALGKLCPRGHAYHGTGKSLVRRSNNHCVRCDSEKTVERQRTKHQAARGAPQDRGTVTRRRSKG